MSEVKLIKKTKGPGVAGLAAKAKSNGTKVGFVKGLGRYPGEDVTISEVAAKNEFGTPERPFLRTTIIENKSEYKKIFKTLMSQVLREKISNDHAAKLLGEKAVLDVKNKILTLTEPPNSEITVARKGSSNPLIDTGLMRQSVSFELVK